MTKAQAKKQVAKTVKLVEAYNVTAKQIADELQMNAKSLRRKLRNETRDENNPAHHKNITRATRYAFTRSEADDIVARFSQQKQA
jgi:hypothetical protein